MLFARRRWAVRITEEMGISVKSAEATWLIENMIWGAKNLRHRNYMTKRQAIFMVAATMVDNHTAASNLARKTALNEEASLIILESASVAAKALAKEYQEEMLLRVLAENNKS